MSKTKTSEAVLAEADHVHQTLPVSEEEWVVYVPEPADTKDATIGSIMATKEKIEEWVKIFAAFEKAEREIRDATVLWGACNESNGRSRMEQ